MNLIEELENQFKSKCKKGTIEEKEKIAVDFLNSVDFKNASNKSQAEQYIKHILNDFVAKNEEISSLEAKIIHCIIAKISLADLNLDNVKVNYLDRTSGENAGAFYRKGTINFFNDSVCNKHEWLLPYGVNVEKGARSRLNYFVNEVFKTEHEIQHAVQFEKINISEIEPEKLSIDDYIISKQVVARIFAQVQGSKYYNKDLNIDRLYHDNHDQFYYEIDADLQGLKRALSLLSELSMPAYNLAVDEKIGWRFLSKLKDKQSQMDNYSDITWDHNTNPDNVKVSANHKASMIIDYVLPRLNGKERGEFMGKYPALQITYNSDGTKKDLAQIEREFAEKKSKLLINGTAEEIRTDMPNLMKLYTTAIESDPVLSFEKCLQHIARMTWDRDRYFTDSGAGVKYDSTKIGKEIEQAKQKAIKIARYLEDTQAKTIDKILDKYRREIFKNAKYDRISLRFLEDKKLAIYSIESEIQRNREVKAVIEKDRKENAQKRIKKQMQRDKALETIKEIFPNFAPTPQTGIIKDGSIEFTNNVYERMMLMEAYKQYVDSITGVDFSERKDKNFVYSGMLLSAINELYDFTPTEEEQRQFDESLKKGEVKVIKNKYQTEEVKMNGGYTQEEIERTEGRTFSWGKLNQDVVTDEQDKNPSDPESDAEKARFQSQRQVVTEKNRQQVEEQKREKSTYVDEYGVVQESDESHEGNQQNKNQDLEISR